MLQAREFFVMKKVFSALFLAGAMSVAQPLFADVVYHLTVLVDPNLSDSIILVNLFPGNSLVSVTNPDSVRSGVFTVQQRTSIGRNIALSPSAFSRMGFVEGSIAEVRILELALDGDNAEVNPAAEYQDIVASPTEDTFYRPAPQVLRTAPNTEDYSRELSTSSAALSTKAAAPNDKAELFQEEPSVTGLPPAVKAPSVVSLPTRSSVDSLIINTKDENLRIPLPSQSDDLLPQNLDPNPNSGVKNFPESSKDMAEKESLITTQIPAGDPFTARSNPGSEESKTDPVLSNLAPKLPKKQIPAKEVKIPQIDVISPMASPYTAKPESLQTTSKPNATQKTQDKTAKPQKETVIPVGDARPISGHTDKETSNVMPPEGNNSGSPLQKDLKPPASLTSISLKPDIYFPTAGDMNPPPGSGELAEASTIAAKPSFELKASLNNREKPIAPSTDKPLPKFMENSDRDAVTRVPQIIGNLNDLGLPSGYYIQLASFQDVRKTRQVYEQFVNEYQMNVIPALINGKKYYRCLIGNLNESEVAELLRKVRAAGYKDAFVYKNN